MFQENSENNKEKCFHYPIILIKLQGILRNIIIIIKVTVYDYNSNNNTVNDNNANHKRIDTRNNNKFKIP